MKRSRMLAGLVLTTAVVGLTVVAPSGAAASSGDGSGDGGGHEAGHHGELKRVRILDDCEQHSFDAVIGAGTCVGDGETTFGEFISQLVATTPSGVPSVEGWAFKASRVTLHAGEGLRAVNVGGEFHTFTEVKNFGGGCLTDVPVLSGPQKPVPECTPTTPLPNGPVPTAFLTSGLRAGATHDVTGLAPGTHKFECLIHPWMRTTVVVRGHH